MKKTFFKSNLVLILLASFLCSCSTLNLKKAESKKDEEEKLSKAKKAAQQREYNRLKRFQNKHDKGGTNW
jgi:hypothetical protein